MAGLYKNFFQGNRSELLADFLLSSIGITTPARRQFDHGVDFYCNLIKNGSTEYLTFGYPFTIQIKSISKPNVTFGNREKWRPESISWLFENELPFFIGIVDKKKTSIDIYDTTGLWQLYLKDKRNFSQVILKPGNKGKYDWRDNIKESKLENWDEKNGDSSSHTIDLGNSIININSEDLKSEEILSNKIEIFREVIKIEQGNIIRRNLGIKCFKEIKANATNESYCQWGMNFRDFEIDYILPIYDALRLPLISLSINLRRHDKKEELEIVNNLLKIIPKDDYYKDLYEKNPEAFEWIKDLL